MTQSTANELDNLVSITQIALEKWLGQPDSKDLQREFKNANLALLQFSRSQKQLLQ